MNKLMLILQQLEEAPHKFELLRQEINTTILKIKACKDIFEAQMYFDVLQNAQDILSKLSFVEGIKLPDGLVRFVNDCDRLDDKNTRDYFFNKIKKDEYFI